MLDARSLKKGYPRRYGALHSTGARFTAAPLVPVCPTWPPGDHEACPWRYGSGLHSTPRQPSWPLLEKFPVPFRMLPWYTSMPYPAL
jgi:hypothetical protein